MKSLVASMMLALAVFLSVAPAFAAEVPVESSSLEQLLEQLILAKGVDLMVQNIKASERESGDLNKAVRATLGISIGDIQKYGLLGGPNSEMRKLFSALGIK